MKQSVSFVTIAVNDFQKELTFYKEVMGWKPFKVIEGTIAFSKVGSFVLSLCSTIELSKDIGKDLKTEPYLGFTLAQNVPNAEAVDDIFGGIRKSEGLIVTESARASWGGYSGYFTDPEGHLWEVAYNPEFEYGPDCNMIIPW